MKRIIAVMAALAAMLVTPLAVAECTLTSYVTASGRTVYCNTCCTGDTCVVNCF